MEKIILFHVPIRVELLLMQMPSLVNLWENLNNSYL